MTTVDLRPAAEGMARLVRSVPDELLDRPTPCPDYALGDLLDHIGGFAIAFTGAARKAEPAAGAERASGDASRLGDDWRDRIPRDLTELAEAWRDPAAWTGTTQAGGIQLPGDVAGLVALDELVVHGWDVARASGQDFACDPTALAAVHAFLEGLAGPGREGMRSGIFGPVVEVDTDAPLLDRVIGLAGRDPGWAPPS
ncbi:MAG TPA: TIGR03086 family metal-binding protein [Acidimicrobiales bacterium]